MESAGLAPATVARRLSAYPVRGGPGREPRTYVPGPLPFGLPRSTPYRDVRGPGRAGWRALAAQLSGPEPLAARNLAIARLLHDLGLRRSEAVGLGLEHLEREGGAPSSVWVQRKGKRDRQRMELAAATATALDAWLRFRGAAAGPIFVRLDRPLQPPYGRLSGRAVARIIGRAGIRAGLDLPGRPHGLRHEAITRALELGESLLDAQVFAGHADPRTTGRVSRPAEKSAAANQPAYFGGLKVSERFIVHLDSRSDRVVVHTDGQAPRIGQYLTMRHRRS